MNTIFDPTDLVFVNPLIQMADGGARINFDGKWKVMPTHRGLTFVKVEEANAPALIDQDVDDSYPRRDDCCESGQGSGDDSYW